VFQFAPGQKRKEQVAEKQNTKKKITESKAG
jgi:hypothetical protein